MRTWSIVAALLCLVSTLAVFTVNADGSTDNDDDVSGWIKFKANHRKNYMTHDEDSRRFNQWLANRFVIKTENSQAAGYTLADNEFSDWYPHEYKKLLGFRSNRGNTQKEQQLGRGRLMPTMKPDPQYNPYTLTMNVSLLPASVNWVDKGAVNPIQNQGQCGDCWAFSACGALEGQYFLTTGRSVVMSEQNLVDCTTSYGNYGCNGGAMNAAFDYVEQNKGIDTNASYIYTATNGTCRYNTANSVGFNQAFQSIQTGNELALQQAVALIGPISVGIDASQPSFQLYKSGVYSSPKCSSVNLDHAVLAVGYGTQNNQDYWLLKNSWGTSWGQSGYMMMARNDNNMCGIATDASFPSEFIASSNIYQASGSTKALYHVRALLVILLLNLLANRLF